MKFDTMLIHGGEGEKKPANSLNNPIFMTSTFTFDNLQHAEQTFSFETDDYVYTRGNNPTLKILEKKLALLEGGSDSVAFSSGMAAISSSLFSLLKPGDEILAHRVLYGSSYNLIKNILTQYGINCRFIDLTETDNLQTQLDSKSKIIYFETPSNPDLSIIDIEAVSNIARDAGIKVLVDNTFATPCFQRPLKLGADVVVHSATKYLSGHGDVLGGIVIAREQEYIDKLKFNYLTEFGGVLSPFNAWLILRGLKTLALRMRQQQDNAVKLAEFLDAHPEVDQVFYPGLDTHKNQEIAEKQMTGTGAMLAFEPVGGREAAVRIVESLELIKLAVSLGDVETLIEYPFAMTHRDYSAKEVKEIGISPELIRISVGLEDVLDVIEDLNKALK